MTAIPSRPGTRLRERIRGLTVFIEATAPYLAPEQLAAVRAVIARVDRRLVLSPDHTVVALAGATGSGKSSLFNALTATTSAEVGVRRPTTASPIAAATDLDAVADLLDWLDVPAPRRVAAGPPRIALIDLPDMDSVATAHRQQADRLIGLVDLVVWVTDPQKYADRVWHIDYLQALARHAATTVVTLNQADRLAPDDRRQCVRDLGRLLAEDGLDNVPVLAVSATTEPGIDPLRAALNEAAQRRTTIVERLSADADDAIAGMRHLIGPAAPDPGATGDLVAAFATAGGVPAAADAAAAAYRFRAQARMGWPITRWIRRLRTDPLVRLRLDGTGGDASSLPARPGTVNAVVDLAMRGLCDRAGRGLPAPWPDAVRAAAGAHRDDLVDALDRAVVATDLGLGRRPLWWRLTGTLQWLLTMLAAAGAAWLLARLLLILLGLGHLESPGLDMAGVGTIPYPTAALVGGAACGLLIALLTRPLVAVGARRARHRATVRLRHAVAAVIDEQVVEPVRAVLADYNTARKALPR